MSANHQASTANFAVNGSDFDYVTSARAAVLHQNPTGGQHLLWAVVAFFICIFCWAAVAEIDEFTRGEGKVIPSQYVQVVQNLEGGILAELYIKEGQLVSRGQNLLRIDDTRFSSSFREAGITLTQLDLRSKRLAAEARGEKFEILNQAGIDKKLLMQEQALYRSRREELVSNVEVLQQQVAQKRQVLSELQAQNEGLQRSYSLLKRELQLTQPLAGAGAISEVEVLRLQRQVNDLAGELEAAELALPRAQSSLQEVEEKLANVTLVFRRQAREQLNEITLELSRLKESSEALADRVKRTLVKSPVEGTVKRLLLKTIGGVIQPGMDMVEIVPSEEKLLIEVRIRPADIAYLHPGQNATVKFSAYDFSVMGGLDGEVVHISPDTISDSEGRSFYLARVETSHVFTRPDGSELPIIPGMTVSVDILTGKKTILDYLLKPILKTKQLALKER